MVALVEVAAEVLATNAKSPNGGRPTKLAVSEDKIAERLGVSQRTINNATRHVAAIEEYPELEALSQAEAIRMAASLEDTAYGLSDEAGKDWQRPQLQNLNERGHLCAIEVFRQFVESLQYKIVETTPTHAGKAGDCVHRIPLFGRWRLASVFASILHNCNYL